jgi:hypothetical protein
MPRQPYLYGAAREAALGGRPIQTFAGAGGAVAVRVRLPA